MQFSLHFTLYLCSSKIFVKSCYYFFCLLKIFKDIPNVFCKCTYFLYKQSPFSSSSSQELLRFQHNAKVQQFKYKIEQSFYIAQSEPSLCVRMSALCKSLHKILLGSRHWSRSQSTGDVINRRLSGNLRCFIKGTVDNIRYLLEITVSEKVACTCPVTQAPSFGYYSCVDGLQNFLLTEIHAYMYLKMYS